MKRILMKYFIFSIIILCMTSCGMQQYDMESMSGRFEGVERAKNPLSIYMLLDLNKDSTCVYESIMDLSRNTCQGKWNILNNRMIYITCNDNPILSDIEKALQCGDYIEDSLQIKVLSKNKLKIGNAILKRK